MIADFVYTWVGVGTLWWLAFWAYPALQLDRFRERMFTIRDEMFDYAAAGNIPFEHPAYGMLRITMNGFLRLGHRVSLGQVALYRGLLHYHADHSFQREKTKAFESLNSAQREALEQYERRMHLAVASHLKYGSIFTTLFVWPLLRALLICLGFMGLARQLLTDSLDSLDGRAHSMGMSTEPPVTS